MKNCLEANPDGHIHLQISPEVKKQLDGFIINPGNFSLFDVVMYMLEEYHWKFCGSMPFTDFIRKAQKDKCESAVVFGDAIIKILEDDENEKEV